MCHGLRLSIRATAAITAGLLMTACQNGTDDNSSGQSGTGTTASAGKASDSNSPKGISGIEGINEGKGVNGTWFGKCAEAEPEKAAKKGFTAEVVISNGIATTIRDDR